MADATLIRWAGVAICGLACFVVGQDQVRSTPRPPPTAEMQVVLPLAVQVAMAAGDRHLAANMAGIRALVSSTENMKADEFRVLAKVQEDVSWLNPAHEDNYYTAAAILPWNGEVDAAQTILARATRARPYDYQPALYYAFHVLHFKRDPAGAAEWLRNAAERMPEGDERLGLQDLAAQWTDRVRDLDVAIRIVENMARQARRKDFRAYLESRVRRLQGLRELRQAGERFREARGRPPAELAELVAAGLIPAIPDDPFGLGYRLDSRGEISLRNSPQ